ncbi:MAG: type I restriction enzyme HsdR N-terminal domain-containing protein [Rikenellaceae bacterium]
MTQPKLPRLNFPPISLKARRGEGAISVWDSLRKIYVVLTPEEWVRQHLIAFLLTQMQITPLQIVVEYSVKVNGQSQRADIVVIDRAGRPSILVECKAPEVKISQSTLDQAVRYNSVVGARYLILTNGLSHHIYQFDSENSQYRELQSFEQIRG